MSNEHNLFFQQAETGETPVYSFPTVRTRVSAPCPGRLDNIVTLISGDDAINGISRPKNIGTCALHIACYEQNGTFVGSIKLDPGESLDWFQVPSNTRTIKFGCHKSCSGTAVLEYNTPYIS
jgi:hypothetical protein